MLELFHKYANDVTALATVGGWLFALGVWRGDYREFKRAVLEDLRILKKHAGFESPAPPARDPDLHGQLEPLPHSVGPAMSRIEK